MLLAQSLTIPSTPKEQTQNTLMNPSRMTHTSLAEARRKPVQKLHPSNGYTNVPRAEATSPLNATKRPCSPHPLSVEYKDAAVNADSADLQSVQAPVPIRPGTTKESPAKLPEESVTTSTTSTTSTRPSLIRFYSTPTLPCLSPTRQQFRLPNASPRLIKETLNASLRVDETGKKINQYQIKEEIGRGSFGTVWSVVDTNTNEKFVGFFAFFMRRYPYCMGYY